jgi:DNA-binding MarR family transcriptional regulator
VHAGLVARTENPDDRRARQIELSPKGRALIDTGVEERYLWLDDMVAGLPLKERAALLSSLPHLIAAEKALPVRTDPRGARHAIRTPRARPQE